MQTINHYLTLPPVHEAGKIAFLTFLALLAGSSLLAFFAEFKKDTAARADYSVLSQKISSYALVWIIILGLSGGLTLFLPGLAGPGGNPQFKIVAAAGFLSLVFFLLYHFTFRLLKIRLLHCLPALVAVICAFTAAAWWYLPHTCEAWLATGGQLTNSQQILSWWLGREEVARFTHFIFNALALGAILFLLANAREKENKRKQPREYYFKAATFAEAWLLCATAMELLPLGWIYYNRTFAAGSSLLQTPEIYWLAAIVVVFLLGWLLLLKIVIDGLVNRRATMIIAIMFFLSLGLFHFGPLYQPATSPARSQQVHRTPAAATGSAAKPEAKAAPPAAGLPPAPRQPVQAE